MASIVDVGTGLEVKIRDDYVATGTVGALNAEVAISCRGSNQVVMSFVGPPTPNMVISFEGSVDGTNYVAIPGVKSDTGVIGVSATINTTVPAVYIVPCAGFQLVRARVSTYTTGSVTAVLRATAATGPGLGLEKGPTPYPAILHVTATAAMNTAATCSLPGAGVGLRHYITRIRIERLYSVVGVAAAAATNVTTTNMPGSPIFGFSQAAAAQGTMEVADMDFSGAPIQVSSANTATTIVGPAQLQTIWRISAWYYVAP